MGIKIRYLLLVNAEAESGTCNLHLAGAKARVHVVVQLERPYALFPWDSRDIERSTCLSFCWPVIHNGPAKAELVFVSNSTVK